jgi:hypothetical protein
MANREGTRAMNSTRWLSFLDTYRTMCLALEQAFKQILEKVREFGVAA